MIINARKWTYEDFQHGQCLVVADGVEVPQAWYTDTDRCIVKTYDVAGDGKPRLVDQFPCDESMEILDGQLLSRTISAKSILVFPLARARPE